MVLTVLNPTGESNFLTLHIPELFDRFSLSYEKDDTCLEYFLWDKDNSKQVSKNLIISHEAFTGSLYVSKFYPELYKEINCKYLSAACFYMMTHHAVKTFHLLDNCNINLETDTGVFESFYSRLNDFNFKIRCNRPCEKVCLLGNYHKSQFATDMIVKHDKYYKIGE